MFLAVYGEDSFRVREFAADLLEKFVAKYDPSRLNVEVFDFATTSPDALISSLKAAPFLAEKRFLFLHHVADTLKKTDVSFWTELFAGLHESTSVCFVDTLDVAKFHKSSLGIWLATLSSDRVKHFPLAPLTRHEYVAWIRARAVSMGASLSEKAASILYERVGGVGQELVFELHKLAAYASCSVINEEMVERLVSRRTMSDFFTFLDLLPAANPEALVQALHKEEESGSDARAIFGGLLRQLRILVSVTSLLHAGVTDYKAIAEILGIHPFVAQKALQASRFFSPSALYLALDRAVTWDRGAKSGLSAEIMVDRLLEELLFARKILVS